MRKADYRLLQMTLIIGSIMFALAIVADMLCLYSPSHPNLQGVSYALIAEVLAISLFLFAGLRIHDMELKMVFFIGTFILAGLLAWELIARPFPIESSLWGA